MQLTERLYNTMNETNPCRAPEIVKSKAHHSRYSFYYVIVMLWWTAQTSAKICKPSNATAFATVFTQSGEFQRTVRMFLQ